jgi:P-type Ca2+ transporter type 2C
MPTVMATSNPELNADGLNHRVEVSPHAVEAADMLRALGVDLLRGQSHEEVAQRRARHGVNVLQVIRPRPAWRILLDQFGSLIVGLLGLAAVVAWATGDAVEAAAIVVVLVLNAFVGFATEWQAGRALDALRRQARTQARVRRDGREMILDAADLVPGDIIVLNAGDRVPADARIIEAASLRVEESALTGESAAVGKAVVPVASETLLAERHSMVYLGTTIAAGHAVAVVTATGARTELGRIGRLVAEVPDESTPLERRLAELGRRLVYIVLAIAVVVIVAGWLRGDNLWMMVKVGVSLAVAAVPEGLPAVTTLILALGVLRLARERAIVRRLPAVETLGSTTIICTDKTGTLTENRMTVREYRLAGGETLELDGSRPLFEDNPLLSRALRVGVLCNEAVLDPQAPDGAGAVGDPTEIALLVAADGLGIDVAAERARYSQLEQHPFDAATKRMITVHRGPDGMRLASLKGAPAAVLELCDNYAESSTAARRLDREARHLLAVNEEMADRALRVLALAEKRLDRGGDARGSAAISDAEIESGYTFLGYVGMIDPPRAEAAGAIRQAREAGIRVVMLTGDQIRTARAIARELRLSGGAEPYALHARDLAQASPDRIAELARTTDVFARVSPEDKLNIVAALQQGGEIVAVTGDGVNDAPALKRADIGVAMGQRGTEAAKEAADVVLADDNFATIVRAVEGGRTIYANIIKFVHLMFTHNLGEVITIFLAIVVGWPLPLLPLQILWINLVTDVFPALALAMEPSAPDVMRRRPRSPRATLLSRQFLLLIAWQGTLLGGIALAVYYWALHLYGAGPHARTLALLALVGVQLGHMFNCRSRRHSAFTGLFRNPFVWLATAAVIGLQLLALYLRPLARVLDTVVPTFTDWMVVGACIVAPIIVVEGTKLFARQKREQKG